jgi:ABC-type uncharacterized transport system permease subunit
MPTSQIVQLALLAATGALFAAAFVLGFRHLRRAAAATDAPAALPHESSMGPNARAAVTAGAALGAALFLWRALAERSLALPLSNPFDAFLALALMLAFALLYLRWTRHLRALSFFLLPMIAILLFLGVALALAHPATDGQDYRNAWSLLHIITILAGTICFVLACVGGAVYLLADRQLRRKGLDASHRWIGLPPLASIEKFNRWMVYLGFPLLSVATLAGILRLAQVSAPGSPGQPVKIALGVTAWAVYAVLLHVPLNPSFRGRRSAWLYIVGFAFFLGAFAAARWN